MSPKPSTLLIALLMALAASADAEPREPASPPAFTAKQKAAIEDLVANIKRTSRESLAKDDWSGMAKLYPAGTFSCWIPKHGEKPYSFLSAPGIPDDARYTVHGIDNYLFGNVDSSKMGATHFIEISYSVPYLAKCGDTTRRTRPARHFYLRARGDTFDLAYPCPADESTLPPGFAAGWPSFNATRARKVADAMTADERLTIRRKLLSEPIPVGTILGLQDKYRVSDEESYVLIDRLCELTAAGKP